MTTYQPSPQKATSWCIVQEGTALW